MPNDPIAAALTRLHAPKPHFEGFAAQNRVLTKHFRAFRENVGKANARKPGLAPADKLAALLGDAEAPMLRHMVCDAYERAGPAGAEARLEHALRAASESPPWDPSLVAWSYNGLALALAALDRKDEARSVIRALWAYDPFYPNARETGAGLRESPPRELRFAGVPDPLRLAAVGVLYDELRSERRRSIAMGVSLLWSGDHAAAAAMASLASKPTKDTGTWGPDVLAYAAQRAKKKPGAATPLPEGSSTARLKTIGAAVAAGDVATLQALALDPSTPVLLEAWAALAQVGAGERVRGLLEEMIAASTAGRTTTEGCRDLKEALAAMPRATIRAPKAPGRQKLTTANGANEALELTSQAIAAIEKGSAHALPRGPEKLSKPGPLPPSLARWLAFGGLDETKPSTVKQLAQRAHGKWFAKLPPALAKARALPLCLPELVNDTLEVLLLDPAYADAHGETPVLALDVSDGPAAWITAESFGAWLAHDVGVPKRPGARASLAEATVRVLGPTGLRL